MLEALRTVLEEMGCEIEWPLVVKTDSDQAISFCWDSAKKSKIRGCIDKRLAWVDEVRDREKVVAVYVRSEDNMADIHTKCLETKEFMRQRDRILSSQLQRGVFILGSNCECCESSEGTCISSSRSSVPVQP